MRAAVIGAGAMGSLAAFLLHSAGVEVVLYESREERRSLLRERGIVLRGAIEGGFAPEVGEAGKAEAPFDLMVLAVDAGQTGGALRPLSPFVHRDTAYLSLQDGFAAAELASLVGAERTLVALAWISAEELPSGEVEVEGIRALKLGCLAEEEGGWLEELSAALGRTCPCGVEAVPDVDAGTWSRLQGAAAVSGVCAVAGMAPLEARADGRLDVLCREAAEECRRSAAAVGVELPVQESPWDEAVWGALRPPMLKRVEAGEATEVAWMSGRIVEKARSTGLPVPVHGAIFTLVREIEGGRHRPGEAAARELERRAEEDRGMSLQ
ncbi:MAG: ketopantoate reductase family protein [Actinobacteria bacterium]|nr:ketopantoate reductase family protein [Actinomycetota bacterium]